MSLQLFRASVRNLNSQKAWTEKEAQKGDKGCGGTEGSEEE